jgi:hypothetical protein
VSLGDSIKRLIQPRTSEDVLATITVDDNHDGIALTGEQDTAPKDMLARAPSIDTLRKRFDNARESANPNALKCQTDRDYYDGPKQLDSHVRQVLANRKQPPIYTNRVRPAVNGVLGVLESARMDPRCYPRNPNDEQSADVATKTLRYIADESRFEDTQIDVAENFFIEGTGAVIVEMDGDRIVPTQIRWEEFYYDPFSRRADFKDARYMGIAKWKDADEITSRYNVRINELGDPMKPQGIGLGQFDERPQALAWIDNRRRRVMLVEEYAIEDGQWMRLVYIAAGVLEYDVSPWLDDKGRPCNPIEATSCYVDRENNRYGMVRDMIPIQDEVNASRSRSLHLMNSRQVQEVTLGSGSGTDSTTVREEAAKADGVIPSGWQIVSTAEQTQANLLRMQEAKTEIERMGPTPAVLGRQEGASQSGRARLVSQQAGLTELARPMGRLTSWSLRVYEQCWWRARQFWTAPKWIRVTDDPRTMQFLQVNEPEVDEQGQPVPDIDPQTGQPRMQPVAGPDGQPQMQPMVGPDGQPMAGPDGQPAMQPVLQPVQKIKNRLADLEMDIIIDEVPDTANLQQEVWKDLLELSKSVPIGTPQWMIALEMSPIADKDRVIEKIKSWQAQQQQAPDPVQTAMGQLAVQEKQAAIENKHADTEVKLATVADLYFEMGQNSVAKLPEPQDATVQDQQLTHLDAAHKAVQIDKTAAEAAHLRVNTERLKDTPTDQQDQ